MNIQLTKNNSLEIEINTFNAEWFNFKISFTTKCDHSGFSFIFSLLKLFEFSIKIYDHRHWNYDEERYYLDGEEIAAYKMKKAADKKSLNFEIIADTEEDKAELLKTSEYMHDFMVEDKHLGYVCLDQDHVGVSVLTHLYMNPDFIKLKNK